MKHRFFGQKKNLHKNKCERIKSWIQNRNRAAAVYEDDEKNINSRKLFDYLFKTFFFTLFIKLNAPKMLLSWNDKRQRQKRLNKMLIVDRD